MPDEEIKSINDQLIAKSFGGGSIPFQSSGSGWGASAIWDSEIAWSNWIDLQQSGGINDTQRYRQLLGDLSRNSLVMSAIRFLGDSLLEAPVQVKEKKGGLSGKKGESKIVENHKLPALWNRPNDFYDGSTLKKGIALSLVLTGNAYILKNFNDAGVWPVELWWEPHWTCRPVFPLDGSSFIAHYEVQRNGQWLAIDRANVIHIRDGIHPYNQRLGLSGNDAILPELFGDAQAAAYYASMMGGSGTPQFLVGIDKEMKVNQTQIEAMEKMIVRKTTGDRKGQPLIMSGARAYKLGFNPRELDLRESRYMAEDRFCAVQGIPAEVLELGSGKAHSIYNNVKQAMERAWLSYVCPKLTMLEGALNLNLLEDFEDVEKGKPPKRYCEHDLSQIQALQEDQDLKATRLSGLYTSGLIMKSEGRSGMNYGPSNPENEEADDVFYVPSGIQLLKPGEVAAPQPDMGGGFGNEFGFEEEIPEYSDTPLLDTAKAFLKGGPGSGRRKENRTKVEVTYHPTKHQATIREVYVNSGTIRRSHTIDADDRESLNAQLIGFVPAFKKDSKTKSLEFSQAILDLLPNGFLNPQASWQNFPAEMNSLDIPRTSMPQVLSIHRGAMVRFLQGRGIAHSREDVLPNTLTPSQAEYRPDKVEKAKEWKGTQRPILVSADNYIVDGHHQWMAAVDNPTESISIIKLDKEIVPLLLEVARFPSSGVKDENDNEKFWKKAMPNGKAGISTDDISETITLLKKFRYEKAVQMMTASAPDLLPAKSNGDSHLI